MAGTYIPAKNSEFDSWTDNFNTLISASPTAYGLVTLQATNLDNATDAWHDAYVVAASPGSRTPVSIAERDTLRVTLQLMIQDLANQIQAWPGINPTLITMLGLTVRTTTRTPVPTPTDVPLVSVNRLLPLQIELRVKTDGLDTNRFPPGVVGANVWCKIGTVAPISIAECTFVGRATKRFFSQFFDLADAGKNCYYILQFVTRTDLVGPQSTMISSTIPG